MGERRHRHRRGKEEFRALVEHSSGIIVRFDRDLRRTLVRPSIVRETGTPVEVFLYRRLPVGSKSGAALPRGIRLSGARSSNRLEVLAQLETTTSQIHLVVSDVVLPAMGGRTLSREMIRLGHRHPVVFISAHTDDAIPFESPLREEAGFIARPFTAATMLETVRRPLDHATLVSADGH